MHPRAELLIQELRLEPHPEGGWFREVFRSDRAVRSDRSSPPRAAVTTIYFLLAAGEHSRWHRVHGEEIWHFYEGDPLSLMWLEAESLEPARRLLGHPFEHREPVTVVPGGLWQSARTTGDYSLVGCTMGPGFDLADFKLLADDPAAAAEVRARHPAHAHLI